MTEGGFQVFWQTLLSSSLHPFLCTPNIVQVSIQFKQPELQCRTCLPTLECLPVCVPLVYPIQPFFLHEHYSFVDVDSVKQQRDILFIHHRSNLNQYNKISTIVTFPITYGA